MGDSSHTTVLAWPWPGEHNLTPQVRKELDTHGISGIDEKPRKIPCVEAQLHDGDQQSGVILAIVDEQADCGTEEYRELIQALHQAGLNVYATNAAGGEYDARWEHHPAGGEMITRYMSEAHGMTVISAGELLEECRCATQPGEPPQTLDGVEDALVGAATKRLLVEPKLPRAVGEAI
jgi:hypothetical protein